MRFEKVLTADGSSSVRVVEWDEIFHSRRGAVRESKHVFIDNGIRKVLDVHSGRSDLRVLEMGFGTGLNAFLTALTLLDRCDKSVDYVSLDAFPLENSLALSMEYPSQLEVPLLEELIVKMIDMSWGERGIILPNFRLTKLHTDIQSHTSHEPYDILLYDAFGPRSQPELWTSDHFQQVRSLLTHDAFLVTYCAKGDVKRALRTAGFRVETLPGPPGKREMIRAWVDT